MVADQSKLTSAEGRTGMSFEVLGDIIDKSVVDYGFRLAVMWGTDDVVAVSDLTDEEATLLHEKIVPELKALPDPVEPEDHATVQERLRKLVS